MSSDSVSNSNGFPITAWTSIHQAGDRKHPAYAEAINRFVARYWKPVFCFLRAKGYPLPQAEDLTQEFFTRLLERDWLERADPKRGRLRTFLLTLLIRILSDEGPERAPRQKTFEQQFVPIGSLVGEEERRFEPPYGETPESIFQQRWAAEVLANARRRLQRFCTERGHAEWYALFEAAHDRDGEKNRDALADRFRMTRNQVRHALAQVRQWFKVLLHAEVRDEVGPYADMVEEVREFLTLLRR
jgi:DNA-directed RNA polymerase specialized sigma24 family protein